MTDTQPKTIAIADDDPEVLDALARTVRMLGHVVLTAEDGLAALDLLRRQRVDLLLSDIDMPGLDGVSLASIARNEQLVPVRILLTGNARLETALNAINNGEVHRYLQKPWRHEVLVQTLNDALARIDDLRRMGAADHAARRLRAACLALEMEYPGITYIERTGEDYTLDPKRAAHALELLEGTTLATLVTAAVAKQQG